MSGERPAAPEEIDMLAGEYVLGVLDPVERRAAGRQAAQDPQFARAVAGWERRLAPMLTAVPDLSPPDGLWARIEQAKALLPQPGAAAMAGASPAQAVSQAGAQVVRLSDAASRTRPSATRAWPWQAGTAASLALAAGLAAVLLLPARAPAPLMSAPSVAGQAATLAASSAAVPSGRDVVMLAALVSPESVETRQEPAAQMVGDSGVGRLQVAGADTSPSTPRVSGFLAAAWPDGTVALTAFAPPAVADGKVLELWIRAPDAKSPRSLGLLPPSGRRVILPAPPASGAELLVSLEPKGGSPTGAPSGRIVCAGTLRTVAQ